MPYHDPEGDRLAHQQFCLIADKIEADPALLRIPLENIERWLGRGHWAVREWNQWRQWIDSAQTSPSAMKRLLELLRDDSEEARELKGFAPFAGVLTTEERRGFVCASRH